MVKTAAQVRMLLASSPEYGEAVADEVASFLRLAAHRNHVVERLAGAPLLVEPESLRQSYAGLFHRQAFETIPMMTAAGVAEALGPVEDTRGFVRRLRDSATVVAVKHGNAFVYPAFQFDVDRHRVHPLVAKANQLMHASSDPWGVLAWWSAPNPRWGRRRPIENLDDDGLITLATAESEEGF
ncbi:MAG: hypothetical protein ACYCYK_12715 [Candidatus Dormibacteria bacterium]